MAGQVSRAGRAITAQTVLNVNGRALGGVAERNGLINSDLAAVLGVGTDDTAGRYRNAATEQGIVAFIRGLQEWGPEYGDPLANLAGLRFCPIECSDIDGDALTIGLSAGLAEAVKAWRDRTLTPSERCMLGDLFAPLMPVLQALISERDRLKGGAA